MNRDDDKANSSAASVKLRRGLIICAGILLIFSALSGIMIKNALEPVSAEAGESLPDAAAFCRFDFLPLHCESVLRKASLHFRFKIMVFHVYF